MAHNTFDKHNVSPALEAAATTYGSESTGEGGGFAVPPDFQQQIEINMRHSSTLLSRCDAANIETNISAMPFYSAAPWQNTEGLITGWIGEAESQAPRKVDLKLMNLRVSKLSCLVSTTDELLDDAPALNQFLNAVVPERLAFGVDLEIINGKGVNRPLGLLNAPATVSVAAEGSQTPDTVVYGNLSAMMNALYAPSFASAVWVAHPDLLDQLMQIDTAGAETAGVTMSAEGLRLLGLPLILHEACAIPGDKGDIWLIDLSRYRVAMRTKQASSMHVWYDQGLTAFRFTIRLTGAPWWPASVAGRLTATVRSPFICLDERA